jgi:hypothetical protein
MIWVDSYVEKLKNKHFQGRNSHLRGKMALKKYYSFNSSNSDLLCSEIELKICFINMFISFFHCVLMQYIKHVIFALK